MTEQTLKPCPNPWCASHDRSDAELFEAHRPIAVGSVPNQSTWTVECPVCPMAGPRRATEADAGDAWNTRATPPAVVESATIPAGMVPWHGGDSAPEDWDGGPVLFRTGRFAMPMMRRHVWTHPCPYPAASDIIAYTPRAKSVESATPEGLEKRAREEGSQEALYEAAFEHLSKWGMEDRNARMAAMLIAFSTPREAAATERAAKVAEDAKPKNPSADWTEFARDKNAICTGIAAAIRGPAQ